MNVKPAIQNIFDQLTQLLQDLNNEEYGATSKVLSGATIGQHVRHTLEFFICLLEGYKQGDIDYDLRKRDLFLESNTLEALSRIKQLEISLDSLTENQDVNLIQDYGQGEAPLIIPTNLFRELVYNIEHAVHHMALIKIGLQEIKPDIQLDEAFGVANSTLRYRKTQLDKA